jgi:hypothetical protein
MTYSDTVDLLRTNEALSPGDLAQMRQFLAGEYAFIAGQLQDIVMRKPDVWRLFREKTTSDKQADRMYEATEDGKLEAVYRLKCKAIEKLMSAIKTRLEIASGEARNQY